MLAAVAGDVGLRLVLIIFGDGDDVEVASKSESGQIGD